MSRCNCDECFFSIGDKKELHFVQIENLQSVLNPYSWAIFLFVTVYEDYNCHPCDLKKIKAFFRIPKKKLNQAIEDLRIAGAFDGERGFFKINDWPQ